MVDKSLARFKRARLADMGSFRELFSKCGSGCAAGGVGTEMEGMSQPEGRKRVRTLANSGEY
jgi:hypothetical protein